MWFYGTFCGMYGQLFDHLSFGLSGIFVVCILRKANLFGSQQLNIKWQFCRNLYKFSTIKFEKAWFVQVFCVLYNKLFVINLVMSYASHNSVKTQNVWLLTPLCNANAWISQLEYPPVLFWKWWYIWYQVIISLLIRTALTT